MTAEPQSPVEEEPLPVLIVPEPVEVDARHVDDFIDDFKTDPYASFVLSMFRFPAVLQNKTRAITAGYRLFCTYGGVRFRCTGASRLGDVWLTRDFKQDIGYERRVAVDDCSAWSPDP